MTHAGQTPPKGGPNLSLAGDGTPGGGAAAFDQAELRQIWREHRRWIAAIILANKPKEADLDDLLQTVAMQVVRKADEIRDRSAIKPWLRTVAINTARAAGRKVTRRRQHLRMIRDTAAAMAAPDPDEAERQERGRKLMELARGLPDGYREPLMLRCVQGMSYRQIAEVTGLPETTIETRIARGRRMLRELATADEQDETTPAVSTAEPRQRGRSPMARVLV